MSGSGDRGALLSDVLIVGAGPAGLYAAQRLARLGLSVQVFEEHDCIGEPVHCTGLLGTDVFSLPGVSPAVVLGHPRVAHFHSPVGHELVYSGREGEVCVIDRGAFDRALCEDARKAGARITTGARVTMLSVERRRVTVHMERGGRPYAESGLVCVLACGASYRIQRRLGWGVPALFLGSAQTEVPAEASEGLEIFLRRDLAPAGFGWLVPISRNGHRRAKVGVMAPTGARRALQSLLGDLAATGRVATSSDGPIARLLPLGPLARTYGDRVLAVGDAAGLVKPTTGGGIYYSLLSAMWAADILAEAFQRGQFSAAFLGGYEEAWRARLGPELRVGVWFRRLTARFTPADVDALTQLAIEDGLMPVIRAARFNWHHELILRALRHPRVLQVVAQRLARIGSDSVTRLAWPVGAVPESVYS